LQDHTDYDDILEEVFNDLQKKLLMLAQMGVNDVIVDVGFGFSKTTEQNYVLLKNLKYFKELEAPVLVGLSRKSMIWKKLGCTPSDALNGTTALHVLALQQGADLLRVHDVREAVEVIKLVNVAKA
jgi:dihydropteroate synthase